MSATTIRNSSTQGATQSRSMPSMWQIIIGGLMIGTVISLVVYLATAISFLNRPFLGIMLTNNLVVNAGQATGDVSWTGLEAGLRADDQLIAIGDTQLFATDERTDFAEAQSRLNNLLTEWQSTSSGLSNADLPALDLTVLRDGAELTFSIVPMRSLPTVDFIAYFGISFVAAVICIALGLFIARHKFDRPEGLMAIAIACSVALYSGGLFDVGTTAVLTPMWLLGSCAVLGSLVTFGINFPRRLRELQGMTFVDYGILGASSVLAGYLIFVFFNPPSATAQVQNYTPLATTVAALGVVALWTSSIVQRRRATNPIVRDQANSIFIGTTLMLAPITVWIVTRLLDINALPFNLEALQFLSIFPVFAIAYAVLQYRMINTEQATERGLTYGIMFTALVISIGLIHYGLSLLSIELFNASNNVFLIAVISFGFFLLFSPLRNYLQVRIDRIYYREKQNLQDKVQEFNRSLTSLNDYHDIVTLFNKTIKDVLSPQNLYVFLHDRQDEDYTAYQVNGTTTDIRFTADSPVIEFLAERDDHLLSVAPNEKWPHELRVDQPRLNLLKAQTITGLMGSGGINGLVVLTPPVNKARYNYDEIIFFNDVSQQLAIATERSQAIGTLQRRVQELDVLSRVGQAVNFTIELDDLLELIFNQTSRLVPVPNFYIVLYEENINRLYFAFFLEGDDRIDAKEGMRWILGNDLFSEVIKTNTSMLVSDFTEEMTSRGAELDLLDEGLTAWMGVPLAGGRGTLGVMAAGKRLDKTEYTAEQFKIFSDVAALAATSLDKANLFNQTRIRQKQLSVLNDISRQLVATETDVEKLLEIITTSAVDILNSEAGSLFLVADDDSEDLVFRVVIGGGGQDLIGQRIASGKGVVGKVVEIAEPIIVNDAEADPRHNEEVAENFISRSLLAVPLTAKDEVIGVLQVLNKLDGTPFIEDDSNLLTAFASQAAVAIENARLFQQTDQQLAQRVKELETLERLDAQLNRTLELSEVAQITVKQAMDILSADAGALGIVHENPPYLEIVSIEGYNRDEYPADATGDDGRIWSLESGVVKRVMRTRQADITMDVKMDPDYDRGLTNSNSQITLPMISGNAINAILILEKNSLPRFSLPDWALAQRIAEHASVALANAQLFAEVTRQKNSKSEFMGFAAHELKNPLTSVRGYADALLGGMVGAVSDQQKMFLNTIKSNAERMQVLIDDLRDSAKLDNDEFIVDPEPMNVRSAVVETLRPFVNMLAEKNQDLINSVPENLPLIWGDENRIIQVLTNLVSNAHKYSHENTTIEVGGELRDDYRDRSGNRRGRMVMIWVRDQGIGMSDEDQQKLFKTRYFRSNNEEAKTMAEGTGLGMMLTYNIMIQHQGEIWIESTKGVGSTFYISFPLAEDYEDELEKRQLAGD